MVDAPFHPEAEAEYRAAIAWYRERSARVATRFEAEVDRVLESIGESPERYPLYDDTRRLALLRRFPYSIVYEVHPTHVYVIAVAHGARAADYWQGRS